MFVAPMDPAVGGMAYYSQTILEGLRATGELQVEECELGRWGDPGKPSYHSSRNFALLSKKMAAVDPELIHIQYEPGLFRLMDLWRILGSIPRGVTIVVTIHRVPAYSGIWSGSGLRQGRALAMERLVMRHSDLVLVHSEHTRQVLLRRFPGARIVVQPLPVPPDRCDVARPRSGPALFFGELHPAKGVEDLLHALPMTSEVACTIAGPEDSRHAEFNERITKLIGQTPNVRRVQGRISPEEKHRLFQTASIVVLPYRAGGFSSAVLQDAIAHERPVVASSVEPLCSSVKEAATGVIFEAGNVTALASALMECMNAPADRFSFGLRRVKTEQSIERTAGAILGAYRGASEMAPHRGV